MNSNPIQEGRELLGKLAQARDLRRKAKKAYEDAAANNAGYPYPKCENLARTTHDAFVRAERNERRFERKTLAFFETNAELLLDVVEAQFAVREASRAAFAVALRGIGMPDREWAETMREPNSQVEDAENRLYAALNALEGKKE